MMMKVFGCLALLGIGAWFLFGGSEQAVAQTSSGKKVNTPQSKRSLKAARKVTPALKRDLTAKGLQLGAPVFLRALKDEQELELWVLSGTSKKFELFRVYPIAAMSGSLGPKQAEGDGQAPEGFYYVGPKQMNPNSSYHLSFNIGYPNAYDRAKKRTGSFIMIHGSRVSIGCLAMTDSKIEEIYTLCDAALQNGQPYFRVHVFPFALSEEKMARMKNTRAMAKWKSFWMELKPGYDHFEKTRIPPKVSVKGGKYVFE